MLRQLLTLFALISGLGLAQTPAMAAEASVVSVAAAGEVEDCQTIVAAPLQLAPSLSAGVVDQRPCKPRPVIVWTPTVQLKADRALE